MGATGGKNPPKPETAGDPPANRVIYAGDNLAALRGLAAGTVDLIYMDPPFRSNRDWSALPGSETDGAAFTDIWRAVDADDGHLRSMSDTEPGLADAIRAAGRVHSGSMMAYLGWMSARLLEMRRVLKPAGTVYLHCDDNADCYLKVVMDAVFSPAAFRAKITWKRQSSHNSVTRSYGRIADTILCYAGDGYTWNAVYHKRSAAEMSAYRSDAGGVYKCDDLTVPGGPRRFEWRGAKPAPSRGWRCGKDELEAMLARGEIELAAGGEAKLRGWKRYLADKPPGQKAQNIWADIERVGNVSAERTGYPTQKPVGLLERIIAASSDPGDLVLDPFLGSGTTAVAAERAGRRWVGMDVSPDAVRASKRRLEAEMGMFFDVRVLEPAAAPGQGAGS